MSFYRIFSAVTGLFALVSLLALPSSCGEETIKYVHVKLACVTTLSVNLQTGVDITDAYVCENAKVTWNANNHTFFVFFKKDCPFGPGGCKEIDNQHPTAGPIASSTFAIYDYGIVVDGKLFDPHIIGGGGN